MKSIHAILPIIIPVLVFTGTSRSEDPVERTHFSELIRPNPISGDGTAPAGLSAFISVSQFYGMRDELVSSGKVNLYSAKGCKAAFILDYLDKKFFVVHPDVRHVDLKSVRVRIVDDTINMLFVVDDRNRNMFSIVIRIKDADLLSAGLMKNQNDRDIDRD